MTIIVLSFHFVALFSILLQTMSKPTRYLINFYTMLLASTAFTVISIQMMSVAVETLKYSIGYIKPIRLTKVIHINFFVQVTL